MERKFQASDQGGSGQTRGALKTRSHSSSSQGESNELKKAARRTVFTPQQLYYLEERFLENQFPDADQRELIATHLNLTSQHIQVWFQNKRAKARRKLKKMEIQKPKVHVPKPPPFWPQHLPFDSNFTETLQSPGTKGGETSEQPSWTSSSKSSESNLTSSTSTTPTTSGTSSSPPTSADSVNVFSFVNPGSYSPHERYPLDSPFSHSRSASCSNGTEPNVYSPYRYNVRQPSFTNQAPKPTTIPKDSASFQLAQGSTCYSPTISRSTNGRKADSDSLLLLANCATLATTDNGTQKCLCSDITEVSSVTDNLVYNPNACYQQPHCSREDGQQFNQQATTELYPFNRQAPRMQLPSASEMESQELCHNYPTGNIQTPMLSYPLQDILTNQEPEWHITNPN